MDDEDRAIAELDEYLTGQPGRDDTITSLARRYGLTKSFVRGRLRDAGWSIPYGGYPRHSRSVRPELRAALAEFVVTCVRHQGFSVDEVAHILYRRVGNIERTIAEYDAHHESDSDS